MARLLLTLSLALVAGCLNDVSDADPFAAGRGDVSEAALEYGSCEDSCGTVSADGCWCDDQCASYGDCCQDYEAACVEDDDRCLFDSDCGGGERCLVDLAPEGGQCCPPNAMCIAIMPVCSGSCVVDDVQPCAMLMCAEGSLPVDHDGDGCDDACEPVGCQSDADCGANQHCQAIQCIMAPCPPGICEDNPTPPASSCQDSCGGSSADESCWCDAYCSAWGDCCEDIAQYCAE